MILANGGARDALQRSNQIRDAGADPIGEAGAGT
jgi:hypothetical protein